MGINKKCCIMILQISKKKLWAVNKCEVPSCWCDAFITLSLLLSGLNQEYPGAPSNMLMTNIQCHLVIKCDTSIQCDTCVTECKYTVRQKSKMQKMWHTQWNYNIHFSSWTNCFDIFINGIYDILVWYIYTLSSCSSILKFSQSDAIA